MNTKHVLILLFIVVSINGIFSQNLIDNGNFEQWKKQTVLPDGWKQGAGALGVQYKYANDPKNGNCLHLIDSVPGLVSARRFSSKKLISISKPGTYQISFLVKGLVGLRAVVLVKGDEAPKTNLNSAINHSSLIAGYKKPVQLDDWTKVTTELIVPETAEFGDDYKLHISWSNSNPNAICDFFIDNIEILKTK